MLPRLPVVVLSKRMLCPILTTKVLETSSILPVAIQIQTITQTYASSLSLGLFFWFLFRKK